jgi:hypothetical protein
MVILLTSDSWVARITSISHQCPAILIFMRSLHTAFQSSYSNLHPHNRV